MRLFVYVGEKEVAALSADAIPQVGHRLWVKTLDFDAVLLVEEIEHQFDRSSIERYTSHDVALFCSLKPET